MNTFLHPSEKNPISLSKIAFDSFQHLLKITNIHNHNLDISTHFDVRMPNYTYIANPILPFKPIL